jgi:hypothetical protein
MKTKLAATLIAGCIAISSLNVQAQEKPATAPPAAAADEAAELAKKLANPIASLISVPFQNNTDIGIGPNNGSKNTLNIQPVIPITISPKLNVITRIIMPVVTQYNVTGPNTQQSGLSNFTASAFFSPSKTKNGVTWGAGPAFLLPTATNDLLGTNRFAIGPTAVFLRQANCWTIGALVNQLWSGSGTVAAYEVNQLYLQPFFTYNWKSGAGVGGSFEMTNAWNTKTTTAYFMPNVSGVTKLGKQIISLLVAPRIPIAVPAGQRPNFGVRAVMILVFPKK